MSGCDRLLSTYTLAEGAVLSGVGILTCNDRLTRAKLQAYSSRLHAVVFHVGPPFHLNHVVRLGIMIRSQQAAAIAYKKAAEAHPSHSTILCKYGGFAKHVENDHKKVHVCSLNPRRQERCTVLTDVHIVHATASRRMNNKWLHERALSCTRFGTHA